MSFNAHNRNNDCPCYKCTERNGICHGKCPKYSAWQQSEAEKKAKWQECDTVSDTRKRVIWRRMRWSRQGTFNSHREE